MKKIIKYFISFISILLIVLAVRIHYFDSSPRNLITFSGSGFEPGFYFSISTEDAKTAAFSMTTQEGNKYVGSLNVKKFEDQEKNFSGNVNDIENNKVSVEINIIKKDCGEPSGKFAPYTITLKIGKILWSGCATQK